MHDNQDKNIFGVYFHNIYGLQLQRTATDLDEKLSSRSVQMFRNKDELAESRNTNGIQRKIIKDIRNCKKFLLNQLNSLSFSL